MRNRSPLSGALLQSSLILALLFGGCACEDDVIDGNPDGGPMSDTGVDDADARSRDGSDGPDATEDASSDAADMRDASAADGGALDGGDAGDAGIDTGTSEVPVGNGGFRIVRNELWGGSVRALRRSATDPDVVYAGTDGGGLFRSENGGGVWRPTGIDVGTVSEIAIHPTDPDRLLVIWAPRRASVSSTTLDDARLVLSDDGGQTYQTLALPGSGAEPKKVAMSESALWIVSDEIYRSIDGGTTWTPASTSVTVSSTSAIIAHPTDPDVAWFETSERVWRTADGGATFAETTLPFTSTTEFIRQIVASPSDPNRLYVAVGNGNPYRSSDGGITWNPLDTTPGSNHHIAVAPNDSDIVWTSTANGTLARSDDGGDTWEAVSDPRQFFRGRTPRLAPTDALEALVYSRSHEVMGTADGGNIWQRRVKGISAVWVRSLAISPDGTRLVVGSDHGDVFVSDDEGRSFSRSRMGLDPLAVSAVAIDPNDPDVIYVGTSMAQASNLYRINFSGTLFKSIDGGQTFSRISAVRGDDDYVTDIQAIDVAFNSDVLVMENDELYHSSDGGLSWERRFANPRVFLSDLRQVPGSTETSLAGWTQGVGPTFVVSSDLGQNWTSIIDGGAAVDIDETLIALSSRVETLRHYAYTKTAFGRYNGSTWGRAEVGLSTTPGTLPTLLAAGVGASGGNDYLVAAGVTGPYLDEDWTLHVSQDGAASWTSTVIPFVGIPTSVDVADEAADFAAIGLAGGRGLLITRTGGM